MKKFFSTFRKQIMLLALACSGLSIMAQQVVITVNSRADQAGNLQLAFAAAGYDTDAKLSAITDLKVVTSGTYTHTNNQEYAIALETSDFAFLNTKLTGLVSLDLSEVTVTNNYGAGRGPSNSFPNDSFKNNKAIKTITLPTTLVGVGTSAFSNTAIEGLVAIPKGVNGAANFDYNRFGNSRGITGFVADPESAHITTVDGVVFSKDMTELHFYPSGKKDVNYEIPEGVVTIRNSAFEHNYYLRNLTLASTTTTMQAGVNRFDVIANHSAIENVYVKAGNTVLASTNGILYQLDGNRLVWSPRGKQEMRISSPVQKIAGGGSQNSVFGGNGSNNNNDTGTAISNNYTKVVELIDFPATLEWIENGAFVAADSLAIVISRATTVPTNEQNAFRAVGAALSPAWSTKVYVPAAALDAYKNSTWISKAQGPNPVAPENTITFEGFAANNFFAFYNLNLTNATAVSSIATDIAAEGDVVTVTIANAPQGKVFRGWKSTTTGVEFDNANSTTTTFTMPASDVDIEAVFDTEYAISVTNGQATVNGGAATKAFPGDVITITANTIEHKLFKNWSTATAGVTFADANSATTTFTMPASAVSIEAEYNNLYAIAVTNGTATIDSEEVSEALAGSVVTVTASTITHKVFKNWTTTTTGVTFADATSATTTFTMPAGAADITAEYNDLYEITVTNGTADVSEAIAGATVTITASTIVHKVFKNWATATAGVTFADANSASTTFTMPAGAVTIEAEYNDLYAINITNGTATIDSEEVTEALAGSTITVVADDIEDKVFQNWATTTAGVTFADAASTTTTFTMPASSADVTAVYADLIAYTIIDGITSSGKALAGATVTIEAAPAKGTDNKELFVSWQVVTGEGVVIADPTAASTSFVMTATPVTIKAIYKAPYDITITGGTATISGNVVVEAYAGDVVTVTADVPEGYIFVKWTASPEVTFANINAVVTTFEMPESAIAITAEIKEDGGSGIDDVLVNGFTIYPNPTTEYINVSVNQNMEYAIYSSTGLFVKKGVTDGRIDVSNFSNGMYILKIDGKTSSFIKK